MGPIIGRELARSLFEVFGRLSLRIVSGADLPVRSAIRDELEKRRFSLNDPIPTALIYSVSVGNAAHRGIRDRLLYKQVDQLWYYGLAVYAICIFSEVGGTNDVGIVWRNPRSGRLSSFSTRLWSTINFGGILIHIGLVIKFHLFRSIH